MLRKSAVMTTKFPEEPTPEELVDAWVDHRLIPVEKYTEDVAKARDEHTTRTNTRIVAAAVLVLDDIDRMRRRWGRWGWVVTLFTWRQVAQMRKLLKMFQRRGTKSKERT